MVATEYIESGATTGLAGLLEDSPRFDYSGGASCPSLLLEPSRTNLIGYSEYFEGTGWVKESGATIESNVDSSPDGNTNASYLKAPIATNSTIRIKYTFSCTSSQTYVGSIFVKKENVDFIRILSTGATASTLEAFYNVSNGTLGSSGTPSKAIIEDYGNGWYRLSLVIDAVNTSSSATFRVQLAKTDGAVIDNFDGTEKNLIFGGQLEQASYPTSYIPNHSGGSVTRAADVNTLLNQSGVIGQTEGTIYVNWIATEHSSNSQIFDIGNGNVDRITLIHNSNNSLRVLVRTNNTSIIDYTESSAIVGGNTYKAAFSYSDSSGYAFYLNGSKLTDGTDRVDFSTSVDDIYMNSTFTDSNKEKNNYKQFLLFDTRISDNNLATLTS